MRPMGNMDTTRALGRIPTVGGDSLMCELCQAKGKQRRASGNRLLWLLGRPMMRCCLPCAREMKKVWEGALDA